MTQALGNVSHYNTLYLPHVDVTPVILPNGGRFGVMLQCIERANWNIARRLALIRGRLPGPPLSGA